MPLNSEGIEPGIGCVYPEEVQNIGTQLTAKKLKWKAYMQDMGNDPNREAAACGHPGLGDKDETQEAVEGDGYATRHDPFVYFKSVIANQAYCDAHVVALGSPSGQMPAAALKGETGLATDLKRASTTPNLSFITPNLCDDGHDYPCKNQTGGASALADIDAFLETWVPMITGSPAFKKNGLLEITFDESDGPQSDASSCCEEKAGTGLTAAGHHRPGRRQDRGRADLAVHQTGDAHEHPLRPLLDARELGAAVRAPPAGRRRNRAEHVRRRRVHGSPALAAPCRGRRPAKNVP